MITLTERHQKRYQLVQNQSESRPRSFINLPMIKEGSLEERAYQLEVAEICFEQNTLAVLPTGLGKTAIALLVVARTISRDNGSRALILAPTRVLVRQHFDFVTKHLSLSSQDIGVVTGEDSSEDRQKVWSKRVVCATPQVTLSEVESKNCKLEDFSLIVFDEVHRAIGKHAYSTIASIYNEFKKDGRVMGITASLPSDKAKIEEILSKLNISKIEIRDEKSEDVKPYVFKTQTEWIELELSPTLRSIQKLVREALDARLKLMEDASLIKRSRYGSISLRDLLALRAKVDQVQSSQLRNALFSSIRLFHALNLIETQSVSTFKNFVDRLIDRKRGYGMSELLNDTRVKEAYEQARGALASGIEHPKLAEVLKLVERVKKGERAIVFASYRDTVDQIYSELKKKGFRAGYLIGKSGEGGQNQKKQIDSLHQLKEGVFDILVATQVGEEGLDVAECNLVIFYDNVPSAIRFVQRRGRTGRRSEGNIYVLITKGTRDETYYWLSKRRAGDAKKIAASLVETREKKGPLDRFVKRSHGENAPIIFADTREIPELVEKLRYRGAQVEVKQLDIGDFVVSSDIVIERKTLDDFVKSIFDGRLFQQLANMNEKYSRPILVIEGEKKRHVEGIGESAFYGALASVLADFKVPIFFASNQTEVTEIIYHIARREQIEKKRDARIREGRKPATFSENQLYVISGIPGVSNVLADRLLSKLESVEKVFSTSELDLLKVDGIGGVLARRIRELATAKYISPSGIKELMGRDSLEKFGPREIAERLNQSLTEKKKDPSIDTRDADPFFDIPPPPED
ncbi:MAG: DEAD/DEAH box helicase [Nitrososphaerales archaeon]